MTTVLTPVPTDKQEALDRVAALYNLLEGHKFTSMVDIQPSYDASKYGMLFERKGYYADFPERFRIMYLNRFRGELFATINCSGSRPINNLDNRELTLLADYMETMVA